MFRALASLLRAKRELGQFIRFMETAISYISTVDRILQASADIAIEKSSLTLLQTRRYVDEDALEKTIIDKNNAVGGWIAQLAHTRSNILLLQTYFIHLSALAKGGSKLASKELIKSADEVAASLGEITAGLSSEESAKEFASTLVKPIIEVSFARHRISILDDLLSPRIPMLLQLLDNHVRIMSLVADALNHDMKTMLDEHESLYLIDPFVSKNCDVGPEWKYRRRKILGSHLHTVSTEAVITAAKCFRVCFSTLAKGSGHGLDIKPLIRESERCVELANSIHMGFGELEAGEKHAT